LLAPPFVATIPSLTNLAGGEHHRLVRAVREAEPEPQLQQVAERAHRWRRVGRNLTQAGDRFGLEPSVRWSRSTSRICGSAAWFPRARKPGPGPGLGLGLGTASAIGL
jgi:hypothetical protein